MNIIPYQPGMIPEAGKCYSGMPNDDYHNTFINFYSSSDLKNALRSVEYFWQEYTLKKHQEEREYKVVFEQGSAFHDAIESLIVHGDFRLFDQGTVFYNGTSQAKKKFLDAKAANPGKNVVPVEYFKNVPTMAEKTKAVGDFLNIFKGGEVELAFFWIDSETGIKLKCKTDFTRFDNQSIIDFKSTKDCRENEYKKDLANYGYHFSAAMYMEGVEQVSGVEIECFTHIVTNNTSPFEVEVYYLDDLVFQEGEFLYRNVLKDLSLKKRPDPKFKKIGLPYWAVTKFNKEYGV